MSWALVTLEVGWCEEGLGSPAVHLEVEGDLEPFVVALEGYAAACDGWDGGGDPDDGWDGEGRLVRCDPSLGLADVELLLARAGFALDAVGQEAFLAVAPAGACAPVPAPNAQPARPSPGA